MELNERTALECGMIVTDDLNATWLSFEGESTYGYDCKVIHNIYNAVVETPFEVCGVKFAKGEKVLWIEFQDFDSEYGEPTVAAFHKVPYFDKDLEIDDIAKVWPYAKR